VTAAQSELTGRIASRKAKIGIVGLGHVGLPTAVAYASVGFSVTGIEVDENRCNAVNTGSSYVGDVSNQALRELVSSGRLTAVRSLSDAPDLDVIDVCVPTPLNKSREPDLSAIVAAVDAIRSRLRTGQLVLLTSTTYPGTTVELVQPALEAAGMVVGQDVFLAFAPERIDPGNKSFGIRNTPKVVGGATPTCTLLATSLLRTIVDEVVPVSDATTAEMTKLLENTYRSINIGLANEMAIMCRRLGVDVWEVVGSAATKPYGFMPFYPGPGLGGHCIPVDPTYLAWKLRRLNYTPRFIDLANEINRRMPEYVIERIADVLNDSRLSIKGARILVLGLTYKADVGDLRESPALEIITLLRQRGAIVSWNDPHVDDVSALDGSVPHVPVALTPEVLGGQDLVVVATDHSAFDWDLIQTHSKLVLDTRGHIRGQASRGWHTL
jgi:UDP-N-acetyl-D-glucosamine dehydrogenase